MNRTPLLRATLASLFLSFVLAFASAGLASGVAHAQSFGDALTKFTEDSFDDTDDGIAAVVASGHPQSAAVIQALADGRLVYDSEKKKVFIQDGSRVLDAESGQAVDPAPGNLETVRLNNRLRQTVAAALGGLTLMSPDKAARLSAAQAVFKSRDAKVLPPWKRRSPRKATARSSHPDAGARRNLSHVR